MPVKECAFFLGSNSRRGFVSFFEDSTCEDLFRDTYIIKAGPGCGKSTLINRLARAFARQGELQENIYCSSDPDSLDGVILPQYGLAVLDGTAPHVMEPRFPGAGGDYLSFPPFCDAEGLKNKLPELSALSGVAKEHYAQAYRLITASALIDEHCHDAIAPFFSQARLRRRAAGIIDREMPRKEGSGKLKKRFLDGITPKGEIRLWQSVDALAERVYALHDSYGFAALLLDPLCQAALNRGYDVYGCYDPKEPARLLHLLIPELSLAFVSCNADCEYQREPYRRIRADAYVDFDRSKQVRGQIKLLHRVSQSLMEDAVKEIAASHRLHDQMEELYRPHIDFNALDRRFAEITQQLSR